MFLSNWVGTSLPGTVASDGRRALPSLRAPHGPVPCPHRSCLLLALFPSRALLSSVRSLSFWGLLLTTRPCLFPVGLAAVPPSPGASSFATAWSDSGSYPQNLSHQLPFPELAYDHGRIWFPLFQTSPLTPTSSLAPVDMYRRHHVTGGLPHVDVGAVPPPSHPVATTSRWTRRRCGKKIRTKS